MMNTIKRITGLACLAAAVICSGCWFSSDDADSSKAQSAPMDLKAEIKNASDLIDWIKVRKDQTEIQKKDAFSKLKGKLVVFRGEVREVGKTAFGGKPFVSLKVGKLDMFENINIQFNFKDSQASTVAAWARERRISFAAVLRVAAICKTMPPVTTPRSSRTKSSLRLPGKRSTTSRPRCVKHSEKIQLTRLNHRSTI